MDSGKVGEKAERVIKSITNGNYVKFTLERTDEEIKQDEGGATQPSCSDLNDYAYWSVEDDCYNND